jgi:hypothetical protein
MPKQNHLIEDKKSSKKSSKKSFTGKRFIGDGKSKKEAKYESESEGNTTSEMRKILDIKDNNSFRGSEMPQQQMPMQQMPMQQMPMQQMPMQQMPMQQMPMQQMSMQQMPMQQMYGGGNPFYNLSKLL